jgi:acyl-CoA thioesterase I
MKSVRLLALSTLFCFPLWNRAIEPATSGHPVRVACLGDSITEGVGTLHPEAESYPAQLQKQLGPQWEVRNFGVGGRTMLRKADPYDYRGALEYVPDVVIIALGTNDSKTPIWNAHQSEFTDDYMAMIKAFQSLPNHPKVWVCLPPPAFPGNWGITEEVIRDGVIPSIKKVAQVTGAKLVDLHTSLLESSALFPDTVHPNEGGAKRIAELVAAEILQH